jgi:hypothetical protein
LENKNARQAQNIPFTVSKHVPRVGPNGKLQFEVLTSLVGKTDPETNRSMALAQPVLPNPYRER